MKNKTLLVAATALTFASTAAVAEPAAPPAVKPKPAIIATTGPSLASTTGWVEPAPQTTARTPAVFVPFDQVGAEPAQQPSR